MEIVSRPCVVCGERTKFMVREDEAQAWWDGAYAQHVWPDWSAEKRELLISGTHPQCWDELFGEEE